METETFDTFAMLLTAQDIEPFEAEFDSVAAEFCADQPDLGNPELFRDRFLMYLAGT
jgi:hypothetical protein